MIVTKMINGYEYEIEVPENAIIAKKIIGKYAGFEITQHTEGYTSELYLHNTGYFESKEKKLIATLIYKPNIERVILYKHINPQEHIHIKSNSFGINNEIIKNLRTSDYIIIDDGSNKYKISVGNAIKKGQYLHFTKYELQLFIPIENFKKIA